MTGSRALRILLLEDSRDDADLLKIELMISGIDHVMQRVETEADFIAALGAFRPDVVVSDASLPTFSGVQALGIARDAAPDVPFVFCTGALDGRSDVQAAVRESDGCVLKHELPQLIAILQGIAETMRASSD